MDRRVTFNRRQVSAGLAVALTLPVSARLPGGMALGQSAADALAGTAWQQLQDLAEEAQRLGLAVPRMSASPSAATGAYEEAVPAIIDFMDGIAASAADTRDVGTDDVDSLLERASEALRAARNQERSPREIEEPGARAGAAPVTAPQFEKIADEYRKLFATCVITESKRSEVMWSVSKITDPGRRAAYDKVYEETCVPWYFVALAHGMEASFDMTSHLHNGDSLKRKTWQVPANRPPVWNPPTDWGSSAIDAMQYEKLDKVSDWSLARVLFQLEGYNGWRSRQLQHINSPYLWSYSNHYSKGKYVRDGVWDPNATSKQCGAAVMLKALVETGGLALPA